MAVGPPPFKSCHPKLSFLTWASQLSITVTEYFRQRTHLRSKRVYSGSQSGLWVSDPRARHIMAGGHHIANIEGERVWGQVPVPLRVHILSGLGVPCQASPPLKGKTKRFLVAQVSHELFM